MLSFLGYSREETSRNGRVSNRKEGRKPSLDTKGKLKQEWGVKLLYRHRNAAIVARGGNLPYFVAEYCESSEC